MRGHSNRRGQVWVETVIYTLIGMAVIGLVLAGALPKINEKKDEIHINFNYSKKFSEDEGANELIEYLLKPSDVS